jgi:hypothetical protein
MFGIKVFVLIMLMIGAIICGGVSAGLIVDKEIEIGVIVGVIGIICLIFLTETVFDISKEQRK